MVLGAGAVLLALVLGNLLGSIFFPLVHSRMFPWITGRGFGIAAYLDLTLLVFSGIWFRHPWRRIHPVIAPQVQLQIHRLLAFGVVVFTLVHVVALSADSFAHVGWMGAFVPGAAAYRPFAIALGTLSLYLGVIIFGSAAWAGRLFGSSWVRIHHGAVAVFALAWFHGVLAGSDTPVLRPMYLVTGLAVVLLLLSRFFVTGDFLPPDDVLEPAREGP